MTIKMMQHGGAGGEGVVSMVPIGTGKPGKMGRHFPVREKPGNFVKTGKVREFCQLALVKTL